MTNVKITINSEPDDRDRRHYTLEWDEPDGIYRTGIGKDGAPVGYRRGQCFFSADWRRYVQDGTRPEPRR